MHYKIQLLVILAIYYIMDHKCGLYSLCCPILRNNPLENQLTRTMIFTSISQTCILCYFPIKKNLTLMGYNECYSTIISN